MLLWEKANLSTARQWNLSGEWPLFCNYCGLSGPTQMGSLYSVYNLTLIGALLPAMALFGAACNVLSLSVFCVRHMRRRSGNVYLGALAVSDCFLVSTSVYLFTFEALRSSVPFVQRCYLLAIELVYPLGTIAQTTSVYITVMAGIDGFVTTCIRKRAVRRCYAQPRTAFWLCVGVVGFAVAYNMPHFFEVDVVECYDEHAKKMKREPCATELRQDETYAVVYYMYMYTIIMVVGPLALLTVLTCFIITATLVKRKRLSRGPSLYKVVSAIRRQEKTNSTSERTGGNWERAVAKLRNSHHGFPTDREPPAQSQWQYGRATSEGSATGLDNGTGRAARAPSEKRASADADDDPITLIMVVVLFILCNALGLVVNFLEAFLDLSEGNTMNFLVDGSNFLVVFNSSVNFLIYMCFDPRFRATLHTRVLPRLAACLCGRLAEQPSLSPSSDAARPLAENNPRIAEKLSSHNAQIPPGHGPCRRSPRPCQLCRHTAPTAGLIDGPLSSLL